jgi:hypothetical protein
MAHYGKPEDRPFRDRSRMRQRKRLCRQMKKQAAVVDTHPLPWRWDHGVLYDAQGEEITRQFADAKGKDGNPEPKPREHKHTTPTDRDDDRFDFDPPRDRRRMPYGY